MIGPSSHASIGDVGAIQLLATSDRPTRESYILDF